MEGLVSEEAIKAQVKEVEIQLNMKGNLTIYNNMSSKTLQDGSEMFIYMATCSKHFQPWFQYYQDTFQNQPLDKIILTLNRILASPKGLLRVSNKKNVNKKIFLRTLSF